VLEVEVVVVITPASVVVVVEPGWVVVVVAIVVVVVEVVVVAAAASAIRTVTVAVTLLPLVSAAVTVPTLKFPVVGATEASKLQRAKLPPAARSAAPDTTENVRTLWSSSLNVDPPPALPSALQLTALPVPVNCPPPM